MNNDGHISEEYRLLNTKWTLEKLEDYHWRKMG